MATTSWPWAIILCRFSDISSEPQPPEYYTDLYTVDGSGGIADYWRAVTSNRLDLSGSKVFGWFAMSHPSADLQTVVFPTERGKLVQWGSTPPRRTVWT
jgi:hypothetical protein